MASKPVDVFISGAGPVGLVLAYHLTRLGNTVHIIDSADKASPDFPMYGRASTLHPRTCELMDQLDLFDDMAQEGVCARDLFGYDASGNAISRGWNVMESCQDETFFDFSFTLRLKYSEDIFRAKLADMGVEIHAPSKLVGLTVDADAPDDYQVSATCKDADGQETIIKSKYILGCDGGGSAVRKLSGIPFEGERRIDHWVRLDGMATTDMPKARRGIGAIESKTHGHVLWVALDHGATRVGYVLSEELVKKYGTKMSQEDAVFEAKKACAPWTVEFQEVHWHTVYGVQQHVAARFQERERIIIAGDAAHTHSSGSAQGMNTGMHDVVSLGWRLSGALQGWYKPEVLANYSDERRAVAQHLISNDQTISALISGKKPEHFQHRAEEPMILLDEFLRSEAGFTTGLGITYKPNLLNDVDGSRSSIKILPGHRAPDVLLQAPGVKACSKRLYEVTRFNGKFRVVVFTGEVSKTKEAIASLRKKVDQDPGRLLYAVDFLMIISGEDIYFDEHLGMEKFGRGYWDTDQSAHTRYGVSKSEGALLVIRPDGIMGHVAPLDGWEGVVKYLERLVIPKEPKKKVLANGKATRKELGDFIAQDENNMALPEHEHKEEGMVVN